MPPLFPPILRSQRRISRRSNCSTQSGSIDSSDTLSNQKLSLDFTQRIERRLAEYNASDNIFKRWLLELVSWTASAICMGAIIGIYLRINKDLMNANEIALTCANVLGKIASAMLIVPTSEALGQLKWHWFHSSNAIWDFEIFDKASRGPWGAALLLYRTKGRSLAALGALLIVMLLAIDTFFQQVIIYSDEPTQETTLKAQIPRVATYKPTYNIAYQQGFELAAEDKYLAASMRDYFYGNGTQPVLFGNGTRPEIPLSCPTSSCSWPEYDTLAVCSSCQDITHLLDLSYSCMNTSIDWSTRRVFQHEIVPTGFVCGTFLNATSEKPILLAGYVADETGNMSNEALLVRSVPLTDFATKLPLYENGTISFSNVRFPLLDALVSSVPNGMESIRNHDRPVVHECMLSWCTQTMKSMYEFGRYTEIVLAEHLESPKSGDTWPWSTFETQIGTFIDYSQNYTIDVAIPNSSTKTASSQYRIDNATMANVMNIFDDIFPSFYTQSATGDRLLMFKNYPGLPPIMRAISFNPWLAPNNVTRHMERMATSMTNVIRSSNSRVMIEGNAYSMKTFITVRWEWLAFPFILLILSLAFLVSTMLKTAKDTETGVWKTSAMPTLIYGLPENTRGKFAAQTTWNSSHCETKKVRIKLLPNHGWRVSGQSLLRSPILPLRKNQTPPGWI